MRHALKAHLLRVKRVQSVTPHLLRVTLVGEDIEGLKSALFDDHVKVFFPVPGEDRPVMPGFRPNGPIFSELEPGPVSRDFTPRARYCAMNAASTRSVFAQRVIGSGALTPCMK